MLASTRAVKDYLRECGQYNMLTILVMPEFFDLPKGIAVNRSACLIDVYYSSDSEGNFIRGQFRFYSRPAKRQLYIKGKKDMNYFVAKSDFEGQFAKFFPLDEEEYKKMKQRALRKRESTTIDKKLLQRNIAWWILHNEFKLTHEEIARKTTSLGSYLVKQTIQSALSGLEIRKSAEKSENQFETFEKWED